jgi:hypothetical protein
MLNKTVFLLTIATSCFGSSAGTLSSKFMHAKGVLIQERVVLTSAHVLQGRAGVTFNHLYKGKSFCHPRFEKKPVDPVESCKYDIALFILEESVLDIPFIPLYECVQKELITKSESSMTYGDSGSPLILNGQVLGIASAITGENKEHYQVIYTSVYPHLSWIEKIIEENL